MKNLPFRFFKIGHFSPTSKFSTVHFQLFQLKQFVSTDKLFATSILESELEKNPNLMSSFKKLVSMCEDKTIDLTFAGSEVDEKRTFLAIVDNILSNIGSVMLDKHTFLSITEKAYKPNDSDSSSSDTSAAHSLDWLGIGTSDTWHGYPDARIRAGNGDTAVIASSEVGDETPGNSLVLEAKLRIDASKLKQLISTTVVSAFTENFLHQNLGSCIPTIMISPGRAVISLYDVENDYLLITDPFEWVVKSCDGKKDVLSKEGILMLWITVNYR